MTYSKIPNLSDVFYSFEITDIQADKSVGHIYAVLFDDGVVKIGRTKNPKARMYQLSTIRGYHKIERAYISGLVNHSNKVERAVTKGLTPCYKSEFFAIPFECAVKRIRYICGDECLFHADSFEDVVESFPNTASSEWIEQRMYDMLSILCDLWKEKYT